MYFFTLIFSCFFIYWELLSIIHQRHLRHLPLLTTEFHRISCLEMSLSNVCDTHTFLQFEKYKSEKEEIHLSFEFPWLNPAASSTFSWTTTASRNEHSLPEEVVTVAWPFRPKRESAANSPVNACTTSLYPIVTFNQAFSRIAVPMRPSIESNGHVSTRGDPTWMPDTDLYNDPRPRDVTDRFLPQERRALHRE